MDIPRGPLIALPFPITDAHAATTRHHSRSSSQTSAQIGGPARTMAIPGARVGDVPPALPPPRYNRDLDHGYDLAWQWQNEDLVTGESKLAPIKPGSSLLGAHSRPQLARDDEEIVDVDLDIGFNRSPVRAAFSSFRPHNATEKLTSSSMRGPPSPSGINQRLQGENPLAQQNHHQSTHAYDKHLLLKIGKSNSPPGHCKSSLLDKNTSVRKLSIQTRGPNLRLRPVGDRSSTLDPVTKWMTSPTSAVSSDSRNSWRESSMDPRSPSSDTPSQSTSFDTDSFITYNTRAMHPTTWHGPTHGADDIQSRSARGSYDLAAHAGDVAYGSDETNLGSLQIEERPRATIHHGTKRRALSPPQETVFDHKVQASTARLPKVPNVQVPAPRQPYRAESLSSTASSVQYNSYPSSNPPSLAPSSMTSFSSIGTPILREHKSSLPLSQTPTSTPGSALVLSPLRKPHDTPFTEMSGQPTSTDTRVPPSRIGNHFICSCCPKKPKKFEMEEQLQIHENEKQYTCTYCNNRFKNKNEAERHQNSLHLRKQSWSCVAISTYQAAFHPSSLSNPRNLTTDICGFCGDEFTNHPPDWEERIDHLTNVHKFGECNATKKFYRADHFRQHLKHSHAGKSGKWTNILESNCQREEAASEPASLSPTTSEHSQSSNLGRLQSNLANPADSTTSGVGTINELQEES